MACECVCAVSICAEAVSRAWMWDSTMSDSGSTFESSKNTKLTGLVDRRETAAWECVHVNDVGSRVHRPVVPWPPFLFLSLLSLSGTIGS